MRGLDSAIGLFALLGLISSAASATPNSCLDVIHAWRDAVDCQTSEAITSLTWDDGYTEWPTLGRDKWSDIKMSGPCPKYSTTLRELRVLPVTGTHQVISLKAIARRVDFDGKYYGEYSVSKVKYVCERRGGQWRILSQEVTKHTDLINKMTAK